MADHDTTNSGRDSSFADALSESVRQSAQRISQCPVKRCNSTQAITGVQLSSSSLVMTLNHPGNRGGWLV